MLALVPNPQQINYVLGFDSYNLIKKHFVLGGDGSIILGFCCRGGSHTSGFSLERVYTKGGSPRVFPTNWVHMMSMGTLFFFFSSILSFLFF
jgi:hypothetical protein